MFDIFLKVTRKDHFAKESIIAFNKLKIQEGVKKHISIHETLIGNYSQIIKNFDGLVIKQKGKLKTAREHIDFLLNYSSSKYIMFCHDDDLFSPEMALFLLNLLKKYQPNSLCSKVKYIDNLGKLLPNRQTQNTYKIKKLNNLDILSGYFLPFSRPTVYPTMVYDRKKLIDYFLKNRYLGPHEDVRIIYHFASQGNMILNFKPDLYFYRIHSGQDSSRRSTIPRLRLMVWLKNLSINKIMKFFLLNFSKIQFVVFYKNFGDASKLLPKIIYILRKKIISIRSGEKIL